MKLSKSILNTVFTISLLTIVLITSVFLIFQFNNFEKEKTYIKNEFLQIKKNFLKKEVQSVYNYIEYQDTNRQLMLRKNLQQRVETAYNIAKEIYDENKDKLSEEKIKYLIVASLKNIIFDNERSYFFINTNDGKAILFNKKSFLNKEKDVWDLKDTNGEYVVRKQSKIAQSKGEGFVKNYFIKPDLNDNKQYPKLSYVKNFEEFNWHIGSGEYLDDFEEEMKQNILKYISTIRFEQEGYIFVNRTDKKALVFDGKKLDKPIVYQNDELFKKQLKAVKLPKGDFFFYKFKKLNSKKEYPKLAFVKEYKKWNWIIGTGVYIDDFQEQVNKKSSELKEIIISELTLIFILIIFSFFVIYFISKGLINKLTLNIKLFTSSFDNASKNLTTIDSEKFTFEEFKQLSSSLNDVLTARNETELKLKNYLDLVNNHVIISTTDKEGKITHASNAFCNISGYSRNELIGSYHSIIKHEDMPKEIYSKLWKTINSGKIWKGELKNKRKDGSSYWVDMVIEPIIKEQEIVGFTAIRHDITNKKTVEYLSITDELTKLYNRRHFNKKIEEEIELAKNENLNISFIILDIDFFKKYNDTYGHILGDETLKEIAKVLIEFSNDIDQFAFRLGGEEFGFIVTNKEKAEVFALAEKIRQTIEQLHIEHIKSEISEHITVSIGLTTKKAVELKDSNELYRLADEALYASKRNGKNQVNES